MQHFLERDIEYILFIHKNTDHSPTNDQWAAFITAARNSGVFIGGSEVSPGVKIGDYAVTLATDSVVGYMRFKTDDVNILYRLLEQHPVVIQGGTVELCETPKTNN